MEVSFRVLRSDLGFGNNCPPVPAMILCAFLQVGMGVEAEQPVSILEFVLGGAGKGTPVERAGRSLPVDRRVVVVQPVKSQQDGGIVDQIHDPQCHSFAMVVDSEPHLHMSVDMVHYGLVAPFCGEERDMNFLSTSSIVCVSTRQLD